MTTTFRSDTVNSMPDSPSAEVLRRAASAATRDARVAWSEARAAPDEGHTRSAFRLCVLAARLLRQAADTLPDGAEFDRAIEDAVRIESAANELKAKLARIVEDAAA